MDIITLIQVLVSGLLNAQEEFLEHLDQFSTFEETVNRLTSTVPICTTTRSMEVRI